MSLGPVIIREPGEEIPASDRVIYLAFIRSLDRPSRTTPERAILRAARLCGVSRRRVVECVRSINKEALS
jgi:hypothetical protein